MVGDVAQERRGRNRRRAVPRRAATADRALEFAAILHGMGHDLAGGRRNRRRILVLDRVAQRHQPGGRQLGAPGDGRPQRRIAARAQDRAAGCADGKAERGERGGERAFGLDFVAHRAHHMAGEAVADVLVGLGQVLNAVDAANAARAAPHAGRTEYRPRREREQDDAAIGGAKPDFIGRCRLGRGKVLGLGRVGEEFGDRLAEQIFRRPAEHQARRGEDEARGGVDLPGEIAGDLDQTRGSAAPLRNRCRPWTPLSAGPAAGQGAKPSRRGLEND